MARLSGTSYAMSEVEHKITPMDPEEVGYNGSEDKAAPRKGQEPGLKLGDILGTSWGYDQTNVEFFKVVRVSPSGATVDVRQIASQRTDEHHVVPAEPHRFVGDVHKGRRVSGTSIKSPIHGYARLWSGSPAYVTPYGQGH